MIVRTGELGHTNLRLFADKRAILTFSLMKTLKASLRLSIMSLWKAASSFAPSFENSYLCLIFLTASEHHHGI